MTQEEKVERLKELMQIAKERGVATTQAEFAEFIGIPLTTLTDNLRTNRGKVDRYIRLAEDALKKSGWMTIPTEGDRLKNIETRLKSLETIVSKLVKENTKDETL